MNLASLDFALSQISTAITTLTKKNYKQSVTDLTQVSVQWIDTLPVVCIHDDLVRLDWNGNPAEFPFLCLFN